MRAYLKRFLFFLFGSLAIHFLLVITVPDFLANDSGIIPIRLLASRDLMLDFFREKRAEKSAEVDQKRGESVSSPAVVDATVLNKKMQELSLGESLRVPSPDVVMPPIQKDAPREERISRLQASPFYEEIARAFEATRKPKGEYSGIKSSIDASPDILKESMVEIDPATELILIRLRSVGEEESGETSGERKVGIKGPIARRGLTYVPPIPKAKTTVETQFEIKFWVRPDGVVYRVLPVRRAGDIELERIATDYLREWWFSAIPGTEAQIEEWGTVTIEFRHE